MRSILGIAMAIVSFVGSIYVGLYLMFIRGIIQLIQSITPKVIATGIAFGIVRIMFAGFVGWAIFVIGMGVSRIILR